MKWYKIISIVLIYGAYVKFIMWILTKLSLDNKNLIEILPFLLSNIIAILTILIIIVSQMQKRRRLI